MVVFSGIELVRGHPEHAIPIPKHTVTSPRLKVQEVVEVSKRCGWCRRDEMLRKGNSRRKDKPTIAYSL